jgi:EAL domain-containing protein (putative c-di-GMP-specific phosphodiesterase class I)
MRSGMVTSVEALVRWQHPEHGVIGPADFIPLAEQTGLMKPLTMLVADQSLREARRWRDDGLDLAVSINLSVQSLLDRAFPRDVAALLERWGVPGSALTFEVTESTVLADAGAIGTLEELCALGVSVSLDDFGTGYSSLAHLKTLPVNEVKIDRSFVFGMGSDATDSKIVRSTVDLAQSLGLRAVAEGVEDDLTWDLLDSYGCDRAQGFLISRPLNAEGLIDWLKAPTAGSRSLAVPRAGVAALPHFGQSAVRVSGAAGRS